MVSILERSAAAPVAAAPKIARSRREGARKRAGRSQDLTSSPRPAEYCADASRASQAGASRTCSRRRIAKLTPPPARPAPGAVRPSSMSEAFSAIIMRGGVEVGGEHGRHDGGVDHPEPLEAVHAQLIVDHGHWIARRPHAAGAGGMEGGGAALLGGAQQLVVGLDARARKVLVIVVGLERFRLEQPPGEPHAGQQHAPVRFQRQVVGLDDGRLERIGWTCRRT